MEEDDNNAGKLLGKLFLIVGPSGSGKGSIIAELRRRYPGFVYPVSYTTRESRENEVDGEVYHFISREKFEGMIEGGEFLEYAIVHSNNYYGTSLKDIIEPLRSGAVVVREVDIQGFHSIQSLVPDENLVSVFVKVGGPEDLRERILKRGELPEEEMLRRLESAAKEVAQAGDCDFLVENEWGKLNKSVNEVEKIVLDEIEGLY